MSGPMEMVRNASKIAVHPYYPLEVEIAGYLANDQGVVSLLSQFFGGCAVLFYATYLVVKRFHPQLPRHELITVMWFVLSGTIHFFFEGYYALNQANLGSLNTLFGQLWKEYALSDSRYLTQNAFVLCMESVTAAFWGPLCYVVAAMIISKSPFRHPLQIIVSAGQFYGDILYYATSMFDHYLLGITYSRPEGYYFWGYYFLMNFFWIVIPGLLVYNSVYACADAFRIAQRGNATKKQR